MNSIEQEQERYLTSSIPQVELRARIATSIPRAREDDHDPEPPQRSNGADSDRTPPETPPVKKRSAGSESRMRCQPLRNASFLASVPAPLLLNLVGHAGQRRQVGHQVTPNLMRYDGIIRYSAAGARRELARTWDGSDCLEERRKDHSRWMLPSMI
ncbi:hypothetical protein BHE74_00005905 [Ensete ventricosum]|nr:hypothetical protein BHE74_00005905 [Ensete ventricosum]